MDESTSFVHFVHPGDILPGMGRWTTNNHYLNSAFMFAEWKLFGIKEFGMRVHSIIAYVLFVYYSFKISQHIDKGF